MRIVFVLIVTLLLLMILSSCGANTGPSHHVAAFGDSLTAKDNSFVSLTAKDENWRLDNFAVGGTFSEDQLVAIQTTDLSQYDTIVYMAGFNDMRRDGSDSTHFEQTFRASMDLLTKTNAQLYIGTTMRMMHSQYGNIAYAPYTKGSEAVTIRYAEIIKRVSASYSNIKVFDVNSKFIPQEYNIRDGVHPNEQGVQELKTILEEAL